MRTFNIRESMDIIGLLASFGLEQQPVNLELAIAFIASQLGSLDRQLFIGERPDQYYARVLYSPVMKGRPMGSMVSCSLTAEQFYSSTRADLVLQLLNHIREIKGHSI